MPSFTANNAAQLSSILSTYTGDLSACLGNCSNQGNCILNSNQQFVCECNQYKTGTACQSDSRPCSSSPCLNNGTCSSMNNETFQCFCQSNFYYGTFCENKVDLCHNNTELCVYNQGYCFMNDTQPMCKCLKGYSGAKCEIVSQSLKVIKSIINAATIIAILALAAIVFFVLFLDYTKYFVIKQKKTAPKKKQQIESLYYIIRLKIQDFQSITQKSINLKF